VSKKNSENHLQTNGYFLPRRVTEKQRKAKLFKTSCLSVFVANQSFSMCFSAQQKLVTQHDITFLNLMTLRYEPK
ncbi:MAG: hypothetical protein KGL19_03305, partial [Bacteroidota bacterium]|nr:hypothetical protein [Bacteroidota bacterium]